MLDLTQQLRALCTKSTQQLVTSTPIERYRSADSQASERQRTQRSIHVSQQLPRERKA